MVILDVPASARPEPTWGEVGKAREQAFTYRCSRVGCEVTWRGPAATFMDGRIAIVSAVYCSTKCCALMLSMQKIKMDLPS